MSLVDHLHYLVSLVLLALRKGQKHEGFSLRLYEKVASSGRYEEKRRLYGNLPRNHCGPLLHRINQQKNIIFTFSPVNGHGDSA